MSRQFDSALQTAKRGLPRFKEEWRMVELRSFARVRNHKISPVEVNGDTPCVELEHIGQGDGRLATHGTASNASSAKHLFEPRDILFGRLRPYLRKWWYADRSGICSTEIWPLVVDPEKAESGFVYALVQTNGFLDAAESSYGTHMPRADWNTVAGVEFPLPPLREQHSVAAVLSDVDQLVGALEALVTKKREVKQAVMEQLLTGKTRLPGFREKWTERTLGELAHVATGTRNNQDKHPAGQYPFFVRSSTVERIDSFSYDCEAILIPGEGRIGDIFHYVHGRFDVHQRVYVISDVLSSVSVGFLYFYMAVHFGPHAMQNTVKATVDSLRLPTFQCFRVPLPPLSEQRAIAAVLSDMDAEITALEHRLDKTRSIKQGMMQQLLTGSIRLPIPEDDARDDDHDA